MDIYNFVCKDANLLYMTSNFMSLVSFMNHIEKNAERNAFQLWKKIHLLDVLYCQLHDSRGSMDQTTVNNINR